VYFYTLPLIVREFIPRLDLAGVKYALLVATMGGLPRLAIRHREELFRKARGELHAGFAVRMFANCVAEYNGRGEGAVRALFPLFGRTFLKEADPGPAVRRGPLLRPRVPGGERGARGRDAAVARALRAVPGLPPLLPRGGDLGPGKANPDARPLATAPCQPWQHYWTVQFHSSVDRWGCTEGVAEVSWGSHARCSTGGGSASGRTGWMVSIPDERSPDRDAHPRSDPWRSGRSVATALAWPT